MKIDTHSTLRHWFLLITNTNQLIVIDYFLFLLIIDYHLIDIAGHGSNNSPIIIIYNIDACVCNV